MKVPAAIRSAAYKPRKRINRVLMKKVAARLRRLRHEKHYDQESWAIKTPCGTAACIAGHTLIAAGLSPVQLIKFHLDINSPSIEDAAQGLLGLDSGQSCDLFWPSGLLWPEEFAERFRNAKRRRERLSRIAADLLDAVADGKVKL